MITQVRIFYHLSCLHVCVVVMSSRVCRSRVLIIYHVKFTQSTAFEQKRFDLLPLSNALRNLWRFTSAIFKYRKREDRVIRRVCQTVKCGGKGQEGVGAG